MTMPRRCSCSGSAAAEHGFALLLERAKRIRELDARMRSCDAVADVVPGIELDGKTCGIVGLGDIGGRIARMAAAFGMNVVFASRRT
jgi:D-3-phosphoglycerate dehydrogenase / 2-oxoglutarate reductase